MKIIIASLVLVLILSTNAFCHSPSGINVAFKEGGIDLVVFHSVSDPATHYVKKIEVQLNGVKNAEKTFTSQTDDTTQKTGFDILSLKKGDVLEITAYCSKFGSVTKSVTVE
jgi:hypothetical protein